MQAIAPHLQGYGATGKETWLSNPFSILLQTSSSERRPHNDDGVTLDMVRHAIHSSQVSHLFPLMIPLLLLCFSQIGRA